MQTNTHAHTHTHTHTHTQAFSSKSNKTTNYHNTMKTQTILYITLLTSVQKQCIEDKITEHEL